MTEKSEYFSFIATPSGSGKSTLDTLLKLEGVQFRADPVHADGPKEFEEAARAAHDIEACLHNLHDTVLKATGKSLSNEELKAFIPTLPEEIRKNIEEWGLADTEVREQIYAFSKSSEQ